MEETDFRRLIEQKDSIDLNEWSRVLYQHHPSEVEVLRAAIQRCTSYKNWMTYHAIWDYLQKLEAQQDATPSDLELNAAIEVLKHIESIFQSCGFSPIWSDAMAYQQFRRRGALMTTQAEYMALIRDGCTDTAAWLTALQVGTPEDLREAILRSSTAQALTAVQNLSDQCAEAHDLYYRLKRQGTNPSAPQFAEAVATYQGLRGSLEVFAGCGYDEPRSRVSAPSVGQSATDLAGRVDTRAARKGTALAEHYATRVLPACKQIFAYDELRALSELKVQWPQLRSFQAWAAAQSHIDDRAARLCIAYAKEAPFVAQQQYSAEASAWLAAGLAAARRLGDGHAEIALLMLQGDASLGRGALGEAMGYYQRAKDLAHVEHDDEHVMQTLDRLAYAYITLGDFDDGTAWAASRAMALRYIQLAGELGDFNHLAKAMLNEGLLLLRFAVRQLDETPLNVGLRKDMLREALDRFQEALMQYQRLGNRPAESAAWHWLGLTHYRARHWRQAIRCHQQGLMINRQIGSRRHEATALRFLGNSYLALGGLEAACTCYESSLTLWQAADMRFSGKQLDELMPFTDCFPDPSGQPAHLQDNLREQGRALEDLGEACVLSGHFQKAAHWYQQLSEVARQLRDLPLEAQALANQGCAYLWDGNHSRAEECIQRARAAYAALHQPLPGPAQFALAILSQPKSLTRIPYAIMRIRLALGHWVAAIRWTLFCRWDRALWFAVLLAEPLPRPKAVSAEDHAEPAPMPATFHALIEQHSGILPAWIEASQAASPDFPGALRRALRDSHPDDVARTLAALYDLCNRIDRQYRLLKSGEPEAEEVTQMEHALDFLRQVLDQFDAGNPDQTCGPIATPPGPVRAHGLPARRGFDTDAPFR